MTAVEAAAARVKDEAMLTRDDIEAYYSKAVCLPVVLLKNKERPISTVQLVWFGAAGDLFPFVIDSELKMNNRIPFSKMKEKFPNPLFSQLPCLGEGREGTRSDLHVAYCEIRGHSDANDNVKKTALYLSVNKWIGIINTSEGAKLYLMPTSVVSHELGVTQTNYPQMLHGIFVKKLPRENRGHGRQPQLSLSPSSPEKAEKGYSCGKQQEEVGVSVGGTQRRRVSFAPIPTGFEISSDSEPVDQQTELRDDVTSDKEATPTASTSASSSSTSNIYSAEQPTTSNDGDTSFSPGSEISEEGSTGSSLSSSASLYELPQSAKRGRGKRGRLRGRGKRGARWRGGIMAEEVEEVEEMKEEVERGRGGRARKRRGGRWSRGARGRGRGSAESPTEGEFEVSPSQPEPKRLKLLDLITEKEKSARATNTLLYQMLDCQAASITSLQQLHLQLPVQSQTSSTVPMQDLTLPPPGPASSDVVEKTPSDNVSAVGDSDTGLPHTSVTEEAMVVPKNEVTSASGGQDKNKPQPSIEEEVKESELHVHEEVIAVVQSEQQTSYQMDVDAGPYFQAPRPPRRVSLLEYKERMKGKKKISLEEQHQGEVETNTVHQTKELRVIPQLAEEGEDIEDPLARSHQLHTQNVQLVTTSTPATEDQNVSASQLQSVIDSEKPENSKETSEQQSSLSDPACDGATQHTSRPASIEWPTTTSSGKELTTDISDDKSEGRAADVENTKRDVQVEGALKHQKGREMRGRGREQKAEEESEGREKTDGKKAADQDRERQNKDKERAKRVEELERERRKKRERDRKEMEEREKKQSRKAIGYSEPFLKHTPSPPFPPSQQRFNIPVRHGPKYNRPPHPLPIPRPQPPPQPPPQPFVGFPPHPHAPYHPAPPVPYTPPLPHPPPPPQPDVWSMFGSLFAQHNLFPAEDPPPPPPRSPSPPLPPIRYNSPRRMSPSHNSSPPLQVLSPHLSSPPPTISTPMSPRRKSRSPEPSPFHSKTKSGSPSAASKLQNLEAKPSQLDAKQFRIISELIKKTTVIKSSVSIQTTPPRLVSEGTQCGSGFRLCCTALQVKVRTSETTTDTDSKPEMQHRYVQTSAIPTRNTATQTQRRSRNIAVQTVQEGNNPLGAAIEAFAAVLDTNGCSYPAVDAIVTKLEDWLSRQASLSTDTASMSDYEPTDMSCDEDDDEEGHDGVFTPVEPDIHTPSPVVSGASNISEGNLSDAVSQSPSDQDKNEATATQEDYLYSPSHPLESSEECEEQESCLPSPPPPPPTYALLCTSPPPPPSASTSGVPEGLPPWARGGDSRTSANSPWLSVDNRPERTSEEKVDIEEAFADQMLEEQLTKSKRPVENMEVQSISPLACDADDNQELKKGECSERETYGKDGGKSSKEAEQDRHDCKQDSGHCVTSTTEYNKTESPQISSLSPSKPADPGPMCGSRQINTESGKPRKLVTEDLASSLSHQPTPEQPSKCSGLPSPVQDVDDDKQSSTDVGLKETNLKSTNCKGEVEQTSHSSVGHKSHSDSLRRSMRQRQRSEKVQAAADLLISKSNEIKPDSTDSDDTHDSLKSRHVVPHKYETRHKKRSELEEETQRRLGEGEESRELRSRRKYHSDDSASEKKDTRELRSRRRGGKDDNKRHTRLKSKRGQDVDQIVQERTKLKRVQSPPSTGSGRRERVKPMVPTLQAFEDENNDNEVFTMDCQDTNKSSVQQENVKTSDFTTMQLPTCSKVATRECGKEIRGDREVEDEECYLRSMSLPPFKVVKTSPCSSPTNSKSLPSSEAATSPILGPRSISNSPPSSAVTRKKPTLTKDELLAMVRAKKKGLPSKESPDANPSEGSPQSAEKPSESTEKGPMVRSQLDMRELMVNFRNHMRTVSARKVKDASWIHPCSVSVSPSTPASGVVIPFPRKYSLLNPPPPPPGPPPGLSPTITATQSILEQAGCQPPASETLSSEPNNAVPSTSERKVTGDTEAKVVSPAPDENVHAEEALQDNIIERVELTVTEETLDYALSEGIEETTTDRVQKEEVLTERVLETLEESLARETVRELVDAGVAERVREWMHSEDILHERTLESVEEMICKEMISSTTDEGIAGKVVELIQAENILQERVLETVETTIIKETITGTTDEQILKEVRLIIGAEEVLQEQALKVLEYSIIEERVKSALNTAIDRRVTKLIQSEEFLQERAVTTVEKQLVEETVSQALIDGIDEEVIERIQSELQDTVTEVVEESFLQEFEEMVAVQTVVEETIAEVVTVVEEGVMESLKGTLVCEIVEEEKIMFELQEIVLDKLQSEFLEQLKEEVAQELVVIEESLIEGCLCVVEDGLLSDIQCAFAEKLNADALKELEETTMRTIESMCFKDILQFFINDIFTHNLEVQTVDEVYSVLISEWEEVVVEEMMVKEEELEVQTVDEMYSVLISEWEEVVVEEMMVKEEELEVQTVDEVYRVLISEWEEVVVEEMMVKEEELEVQTVDEMYSVLISEWEEVVVEEMMVKEEELEVQTVDEVYSVLISEWEEVVVEELMVKEEELEVQTVDEVYSVLISEWEEVVVEEMMVKEEECVKKVVQEATALTEKEIFNRLECKMASDEADHEESISLTVEEEVSEVLETELVTLLQETTVAEQVAETVIEELMGSVLAALEESCLDTSIGEAVREKVTSQDKIAAKLEEEVSGQLEDECMNEMVGVVGKEFAVTDEVEEVIWSEIEEQVARQEAFECNVTEVLEDSIMDELESDTSAMVADEEHRNRVTYDVTEVIPDSLKKCSSHVHVMDEPLHHVMYEVTEVVPDSPTQLRSHSSPTYIHVVDPDPLVTDPSVQGSGDVVTGLPAVVSAQPTSTYIHVIDTPQQLCSEAESTDTMKLPETTDSSHAPKKHESMEGMVSPSTTTACSPPPLPVFHPTLPKYISQCLRPRPTKLTRLPSPPSGVRRPTPLSSTSSEHKMVGVSPGRVEQSTALSPRPSSDGKQPTPLSPTSSKCSSSSGKQPTPLSPTSSKRSSSGKQPTSMAPAFTYHLRPRKNSKSSSSPSPSPSIASASSPLTTPPPCPLASEPVTTIQITEVTNIHLDMESSSPHALQDNTPKTSTPSPSGDTQPPLFAEECTVEESEVFEDSPIPTTKTSSSPEPLSLAVHIPLGSLNESFLKALIERCALVSITETVNTQERRESSYEDCRNEKSTMEDCITPLEEDDTMSVVSSMLHEELDHNVSSPIVSPVTGNSSSVTLSPCSLNGEDMVLRLEASFSSAPETDSDMEVNRCDVGENTDRKGMGARWEEPNSTDVPLSTILDQSPLLSAYSEPQGEETNTLDRAESAIEDITPSVSMSLLNPVDDEKTQLLEMDSPLSTELHSSLSEDEGAAELHSSLSEDEGTAELHSSLSEDEGAAELHSSLSEDEGAARDTISEDLEKCDPLSSPEKYGPPSQSDLPVLPLVTSPISPLPSTPPLALHPSLSEDEGAARDTISEDLEKCDPLLSPEKYGPPSQSDLPVLPLVTSAISPTPPLALHPSLSEDEGAARDTISEGLEKCDPLSSPEKYGPPSQSDLPVLPLVTSPISPTPPLASLSEDEGAARDTISEGLEKCDPLSSPEKYGPPSQTDLPVLPLVTSPTSPLPSTPPLALHPSLSEDEGAARDTISEGLGKCDPLSSPEKYGPPSQTDLPVLPLVTSPTCPLPSTPPLASATQTGEDGSPPPPPPPVLASKKNTIHGCCPPWVVPQSKQDPLVEDNNPATETKDDRDLEDNPKKKALETKSRVETFHQCSFLIIRPELSEETPSSPTHAVVSSSTTADPESAMTERKGAFSQQPSSTVDSHDCSDSAPSESLPAVTEEPQVSSTPHTDKEDTSNLPSTALLTLVSSVTEDFLLASIPSKTSLSPEKKPSPAPSLSDDELLSLLSTTHDEFVSAPIPETSLRRSLSEENAGVCQDNRPTTSGSHSQSVSCDSSLPPHTRSGSQQSSDRQGPVERKGLKQPPYLFNTPQVSACKDSLWQSFSDERHSPPSSRHLPATPLQPPTIPNRGSQRQRQHYNYHHRTHPVSPYSLRNIEHPQPLYQSSHILPLPIPHSPSPPPHYIQNVGPRALYQGQQFFEFPPRYRPGCLSLPLPSSHLPLTGPLQSLPFHDNRHRYGHPAPHPLPPSHPPPPYGPYF